MNEKKWYEVALSILGVSLAVFILLFGNSKRELDEYKSENYELNRTVEALESQNTELEEQNNCYRKIVGPMLREQGQYLSDFMYGFAETMNSKQTKEGALAISCEYEVNQETGKAVLNMTTLDYKSEELKSTAFSFFGSLCKESFKVLESETPLYTITINMYGYDGELGRTYVVNE